MCNSFWQDNILPKFMFLKYCPNAKPTTALPKFCLTLGCVIFIFLLKHFLEIVWLSSLLLQSMDIFGSKIFLQGPLKGVKTRLGLQCRTPLRFYLLTVIPYPLSLPLVFGLRLGVRQKHIDSRKIGSRKKMGKNKSCIQKKFWAQNNCGTEKGKRYFVQKKLVQK